MLLFYTHTSVLGRVVCLFTQPPSFPSLFCASGGWAFGVTGSMVPCGNLNTVTQTLNKDAVMQVRSLSYEYDAIQREALWGVEMIECGRFK